MGSNFGDFDNDGWLDMYLGTGEPSLATLVPNRMFKNLGASDSPRSPGPRGTGHLQKGHGVACGDWDRDGDVDLFVQTGGAADGDRYHNLLFQNPGQGNHWLTMKLVGKKTNRAAIGARIKVITAGREAADGLPACFVGKQLRGKPSATDDRPGPRRTRRLARNPLADQPDNPGLPRYPRRSSDRVDRIRRLIPAPRLEADCAAPIDRGPRCSRESSLPPLFGEPLRQRFPLVWVQLDQGRELLLSAAELFLLEQALDHEHSCETEKRIEPQCLGRLAERSRLVFDLAARNKPAARGKPTTKD